MSGKIMLNGKAYNSSGRPSREVTMAEWLALPDTKYTDGIVYYVKDVGGANQFPPLIYSDEEREIGVWTDGKPLYEKTIEISNLTTGQWVVYSHNIPNISMMCNLQGIYLRDSNHVAHTLSYFESGSYYAIVTANETTIYYYISGLGSGKLFITIQYTKTTDTAGSGTWTTQGGYAHHYSTSEKVIGTWIDGKPLYEKTLKIINNIDFRTGVEIDTGISNPEFVKIVEGYFYDSPNDGIGALPYNQGVSSIGDWIYLPIYKQSTNKLVLKTTATFSANNARYLIIVLQYTKTTD